MATNRFYQRTPYDIGLYTPPVEVMAKTMELAQQRYDTNFALAESLKNQFIPSLPQDRAEANKLQQKWNSQIDEVVSNYNGDYSKAGRGLQKLMSSIKQDISPGGKGHAIFTNFNNYQTWLKEHQDRIAKGDVLAQDLNLANNYYMKNYTGVGEQDPITGSYNTFNPEVLSDYRDPNEVIQNTYKEFKPEKRSIGVTTLENGIFNYKREEVEGIDANRLYPSFATAIQNDPKLITYLSQKMKFTGMNPEELNSWLDNYSRQRAQDLSYMNTLSDNKMERDPLAVAREKARLDKNNMQELFGSLLQYGEAVPNQGNAIEPRIDPDNWKNSVDTSSTSEGAMKTMRGLPGIGMSISPESYGSRQSNFVNLDNYLNDTSNDKRLTAKNVIPDLARAMREKKKADFSKEYNSKYGKDLKWSADFDRNFWYDYKKEWKNQTAFQSYSFEIPEPAKQSALRMLPDALNGNAATYIPGQAGLQNGLPSKFEKALYNKDNKLNTDRISVKYVVPSAGYEAAGFEVSTPEGKFVIVDNNYQRSQHSSRLAAGLNPIFQGGKSRGAAAVPYYRDQNQILAGVPHVKFEYNPIAKMFDMNMYMYENDNTPILDARGNPVRVSMPQIMDASLPLFAESLGFGQTKSDATPFAYFANALFNQQ